MWENCWNVPWNVPKDTRDFFNLLVLLLLSKKGPKRKSRRQKAKNKKQTKKRNRNEQGLINKWSKVNRKKGSEKAKVRRWKTKCDTWGDNYNVKHSVLSKQELKTQQEKLTFTFEKLKSHDDISAWWVDVFCCFVQVRRPLRVEQSGDLHP